MKIFIISDIEGNSESIIPYGLKLGKHTETAVQILHIIDPRSKQGVSSPYADSKSISPGNKLSHKRILQREENKASFALDKLLSAEASRLNYPLKIHVDIRSDEVEKGIKTALDTDPEPLIVASLDPFNSMITSLEEMVGILMELDLPGLFIPPGHEFVEPDHVLLFTDYNDTDYERIREVVKWLHPFRPIIHSLGIARDKEYMELELKSSVWKKVVEKFLEPPLTLKTTILNSNGDKDILLDYVRRNNPRMVIIPGRILETGIRKVIKPGKREKTLKSFGIPVMIY